MTGRAPNKAPPPGESIDKIDRNLTVIKMQDKLYSWVFPSVSTAVDETAELVLAVDAHAPDTLRQQQGLFDLYQDSMGRLLKHEALDGLTLIDLLTLAQYQRVDDFVEEDQFFMALRVAECSMTGEERREAQRLIWRRCFIQDDWAKINNTQLKNDDVTASGILNTAPYRAIFAVYAHSKQLVHSVPTAGEYCSNVGAAGSEEDENFSPLVKPSDALGVYVDGLGGRFGDGDDKFKDNLFAAMKWEDSVLRHFIEKCRLDSWYPGSGGGSREDVSGEAGPHRGRRRQDRRQRCQD